eukprot:g742.t1
MDQDVEKTDRGSFSDEFLGFTDFDVDMVDNITPNMQNLNISPGLELNPGISPDGLLKPMSSSGSGTGSAGSIIGSAGSRFFPRRYQDDLRRRNFENMSSRERSTSGGKEQVSTTLRHRGSSAATNASSSGGFGDRRFHRSSMASSSATSSGGFGSSGFGTSATSSSGSTGASRPHRSSSCNESTVLNLPTPQERQDLSRNSHSRIEMSMPLHNVDELFVGSEDVDDENTLQDFADVFPARRSFGEMDLFSTGTKNETEEDDDHVVHGHSQSYHSNHSNARHHHVSQRGAFPSGGGVVGSGNTNTHHHHPYHHHQQRANTNSMGGSSMSRMRSSHSCPDFRQILMTAEVTFNEIGAPGPKRRKIPIAQIHPGATAVGATTLAGTSSGTTTTSDGLVGQQPLTRKGNVNEEEVGIDEDTGFFNAPLPPPSASDWRYSTSNAYHVGHYPPPAGHHNMATGGGSYNRHTAYGTVRGGGGGGGGYPGSSGAGGSIHGYSHSDHRIVQPHSGMKRTRRGGALTSSVSCPDFASLQASFESAVDLGDFKTTARQFSNKKSSKSTKSSKKGSKLKSPKGKKSKKTTSLTASNGMNRSGRGKSADKTGGFGTKNKSKKGSSSISPNGQANNTFTSYSPSSSGSGSSMISAAREKKIKEEAKEAKWRVAFRRRYRDDTDVYPRHHRSTNGFGSSQSSHERSDSGGSTKKGGVKKTKNKSSGNYGGAGGNSSGQERKDELEKLLEHEEDMTKAKKLRRLHRNRQSARLRRKRRRGIDDLLESEIVLFESMIAAIQTMEWGRGLPRNQIIARLGHLQQYYRYGLNFGPQILARAHQEKEAGTGTSSGAITNDKVTAAATQSSTQATVPCASSVKKTISNAKCKAMHVILDHQVRIIDDVRKYCQSTLGILNLLTAGNGVVASAKTNTKMEDDSTMASATGMSNGDNSANNTQAVKKESDADAEEAKGTLEDETSKGESLRKRVKLRPEQIAKLKGLDTKPLRDSINQLEAAGKCVEWIQIRLQGGEGKEQKEETKMVQEGVMSNEKTRLSQKNEDGFRIKLSCSIHDTLTNTLTVEHLNKYARWCENNRTSISALRIK